MVDELFPIIASADLERSLRFYRDLLGGTVVYEFPGPDGRPAFVSLDLGSSHLGIGQDAAGGDLRDPKSISLWLYVANCDALVTRLRDAGVTILEEPVDQPWGERVGRVRDPDGIEIHVAMRAAVSV